jgi:hypothetical protein
MGQPGLLKRSSINSTAGQSAELVSRAIGEEAGTLEEVNGLI